jgi:thiol:disulfide interchange protein DsbC
VVDGWRIKVKLRWIALALIAMSNMGLQAETDQEKMDKVKEALTRSLSDINVEYIAPAPVKGLYEVMASGQLLYVTENGKHLINGRLFDITNGIKDLTQEAVARVDSLKAPMRLEALAEVNEDDMIIFKAAQEKYQITVFTDVDCGYCRALHREIPNYNDMGITVRYMGFPRAGIGSTSHAKLRSVWCSDNQQAAMDKAKIDREFGTDTCDDPLVEHMKLVRTFGITGTPAIILESGRLLSGFVRDNDEFLKMIKQDHESVLANTTASGQ